MEGLPRFNSRLVREFYSTPWAVTPEVLAQMTVIVERWASGTRLSAEDVAEAIGEKRAQQSSRQGPKAGAVAVLPVMGVLAQRTQVTEASEVLQGVTELRQQFRAFVNDDRVGAIVLEVDSPGGSIFGLEEFHAEILSARGEKKVVAVANSFMASAAYWIASAAEEIVVAPGGEVGSIGVLAAHQDRSKALEQLGIDVTLISAGKFKTEGNSFEPLSEEGREHIQALVDEAFDTFVNAVAKGRGVKASTVRGGFGEGRVVTGPTALAEGMADRIDTLDATIARLASSRRAQRPRSRAENELRLRELG